ncbi:hypothetical protein DFA_06722 [Cavenderia fasciculata]|uniref:Transmembrane protein n=1 Tax=Cavenderia fasciculata TaxID=261658 RepID=F4Q235_CACFS|nr:uncharacterized protein DFA_06722 [Cavenderia fasciculata]EGG18055.1 hypothetical protein DFA_06722 [Cavenderia fasciculata]|eukprot:XP_004356948.1 hypothetical protein DFA_06722 [Cavenderia fasciculata]
MTIITAANITIATWGLGLITSPGWGMGVFMVTAMMNDSGQKRIVPYQTVCLWSFAATPIAMLYTVVHTMSHGYSTPVALLPLVPILTYVGSLLLAFKK